MKIDTGVHNPARITKLIGTLAAKGDDVVGVPGMEDRPHRLSRLVGVPEVVGDLLILARNYNQVLPAGAIPGATSAFEADMAAAFAEASVPEPSGALLAAATCGMVLGLRRSRRVTRPTAVAP